VRAVGNEEADKNGHSKYQDQSYYDRHTFPSQCIVSRTGQVPWKYS
jgi:hypothetical protein